MSRSSVTVLLLLVAAVAGGVGVRVGMSFAPRAPEMAVRAEAGPSTSHARPSPCDGVGAGREGTDPRTSLDPLGRTPLDGGSRAPVERLGDLDRGFGADSARLVDDAIADRVIDADERAMLGTLLPNLTPEQQRALAEQIARATADGGVSIGE